MDAISDLSDVVPTTCTLQNACILGKHNLGKFVDEIEEDGRSTCNEDDYTNAHTDNQQVVCNSR